MITVLTQPLKPLNVSDSLRQYQRKLAHIKTEVISVLFNRSTHLNKGSGVRGPDTVLSSLTKGFTELNVKFNINPDSSENVGDTVIVLSDLLALRQAIFLKKKGLINRLIAGPNIVPLPHPISTLKNNNLIDAYILPSQWIINMWLKLAPKFSLPLKIWYAGIDTSEWIPTNRQKEKHKQVLVYRKKCKENILEQCINLCKKHGFEPVVLQYGKYSQEDYQQALHNSLFVIVLNYTETQGIALFEAWSCNVPTLVWDRGYLHTKECYFEGSSSAPYLSDQTGFRFKDIDDMEKGISDMIKSIHTFTPRKWVLSHGTNKYCTEKLLDIIREIK